MLKKSVVIEGHKHRQKTLSKKSFKQLDEKARHEIKKVIQQSRNSGDSVLDLSDRNIFSLCAQIADLNDTLKGMFRVHKGWIYATAVFWRYLNF